MPFAPGDIASLVGWFEADDAATLTTTVSGGVTYIDGWANKAVGVDDFEDQGVQKPTLDADRWNGYDAIHAEEGAYMRTLTEVVYTQPYTVFVVTAKDPLPGGFTTVRDILAGQGTTTSDARLRIADAGSLRFDAGSTLFGSSMDDDGTPDIITALGDGLSSLLRKNLVEIDSGNAGANALRTATLGAPRTGAFETSGFWSSFEGYTAEILIYDAALTTNEIADVENYLYAKYVGLQANLSGQAALDTVAPDFGHADILGATGSIDAQGFRSPLQASLSAVASVTAEGVKLPLQAVPAAVGAVDAELPNYSQIVASGFLIMESNIRPQILVPWVVPAGVDAEVYQQKTWTHPVDPTGWVDGQPTYP